jgi:uncharacterized membrane protein (UPF0127 family)
MFWAFSSQRLWAAGWALPFALFASGCGRDMPEAARPSKTVSDWFAIKVADQAVQMQLAIFPSEMEHGLMGRRELGSDQGMLFVYHEPGQRSFWMRNTPLPLDIGFFSRDGKLKEFYPMLPFDESSIRSRSDAIEFALEMNQGWFHNHGIRPGAALDLAALREALKARGVAPEDFGLR